MVNRRASAISLLKKGATGGLSASALKGQVFHLNRRQTTSGLLGQAGRDTQNVNEEHNHPALSYYFYPLPNV
ncbi:hypothetical protein Mal52_14090 [Symmachiella dynata]|uniref:Uncharacterized protein n=1 Tax=Symmachiella dynata TaxID=2527995 RepID=A0A517ZKB5_9PLAN|nr:hypothetical protein Mal52_14090 [Symmachiella dynata]